MIVIKSNWDNTIQNYQKQSKYLRSNGNIQQAEVLDKKIKEIQDVKSRTFKSKVSTVDAMEARKSPLISTVKEL